MIDFPPFDRPDDFELDPYHDLSQRLAFAGMAGGCCSGSINYFDSAWGANKGTLTGYTNPGAAWGRANGRANIATYGTAAGGYATAQFVDCGSSNATNLTGPLTVSAWVCRTGVSERYQNIVVRNDLFLSGYGLLFESTTGSGADKFAFWTRNGASLTWVFGTVRSQLNTWFHVCGVFDGTNNSLYVNGKSDATPVASVAPASNAAPLRIGYGQLQYGSDNAFVGKIADPAIWNRALFSGDILTLASPDLMYQGWLQSASSRVYSIGSAGGGATQVDLLGQSATQAQSATAPAIGETHAIGGQSATQGQTTTLPAIGEIHALSGATAAQSQTATAPAIGQTHAVTGQTATQDQQGTESTVGQTNALSGDLASQSQTSTLPTIGQTHSLSVDTATQQQSATALTITQTHSLAGQSATQFQTCTAPDIVVGNAVALVGQTATQSQTCTAPAIGQVHAISGQTATQGQVAAFPLLSQLHLLLGQDSTQQQVARPPAIGGRQIGIINLRSVKINRPELRDQRIGRSELRDIRIERCDP